MLLEKVQLFSKRRDFFFFLLACFFILTYALLIEFNNYKNLTRFDYSINKVTVIKQYTKTKLTKRNRVKTYQILKLKSTQGFTFYTTVKKTFPYSVGKKLKLKIWAHKINFYEYMTSFYAFSKVLHTYNIPTLKQKLNLHIASSHNSTDITQIYQALFTAKPLQTELQTKFSNLGVSHLLAISGFHLGVLATLLYFLFKIPYNYLQNKYFPYRSYKIDSFVFIAITLLGYLVFLDSPPSLLRAYVMMIVGFILYDRGYQIISMQTLFLTLILLLSFFPRLFFALGFWLSIAGVFYIFLFLIHFKHIGKIKQFIFIPFWVYLMMLPFSLAIFSNFSIYHPLSILWTSLFSLFYPLEIFLHLISYGNLFDSVLVRFIHLGDLGESVVLSKTWLYFHIVLSLASIYKKKALWLLCINSLSIFVYMVYR